uniref:RING finger protein 113A n=1 Tax=Heligmosomoides polygyrus TaxID=6339 RepID=A0A183G4R3_HELPZ
LSGDDDCGVVKDVKRRKRANPFQQSTMKASKTGGVEEGTSSDDSEEGTGAVASEDAFAASGSAAPLGPSDQGATATLEIDTDYGADAQAQFERIQKQLKDGLVKDGKTLYKGQAMYGAKEAKDTVKGNASSGLNRIGPIRAPQFLRQTVRWDYAPDICKDYKETGFCTFGDSCKFLHDRSDYKHGWEIERDYASGRLNKVDETNYEINDGEDEFPEECYICGKPFTSPVVTRCKHYFCEACALNAFRKSKRCQICNENTGGVFNVAKGIPFFLLKKQLLICNAHETEASCSHSVKKEENAVCDEEHEADVKQEPVDSDAEPDGSEPDGSHEDDEVKEEDVEGSDGEEIDNDDVEEVAEDEEDQYDSGEDVSNK